MERFSSVESVAAALPEADIDTDVIFPARFLLLLDKAGLGKHLFHERRYREGKRTDFVLNGPPFDQARILVAGNNFGCGSSREQAVWALADFGIRCVIAPSFGEIFYNNCFKNGLLPIVMAGDPHARIMSAACSGMPFKVDLDAQEVSIENGPRFNFDIDPYRRRALQLGLDEIGAILADDSAEIEAFETRQQQEFPWIRIDRAALDRLFEKRVGTK
jgi:3-isopropylmalate/(R)-2-methylmalate dehydratase small subunit